MFLKLKIQLDDDVRWKAKDSQILQFLPQYKSTLLKSLLETICTQNVQFSPVY